MSGTANETPHLLHLCRSFLGALWMTNKCRRAPVTVSRYQSLGLIGRGGGLTLGNMVLLLGDVFDF